jgi:hypothetical protein
MPWQTESILGLPALVSTAEERGPVAVILGGVHGEEPAPTLAILSMLPEMEHWTIPLVLIPNANPAGIVTGKRLPDWANNASPLASTIFREVLRERWEIGLFLDLHEDDHAPGPYIFGHNGSVAALDLRNMLYGCGVQFPGGLSDWWEADEKPLPIEGGIVWNYLDGSIDDLMSETGAVTIVVETPTSWDLDRRVMLHARAIAHVPVLYRRFCDE